VYKPLPDGLYVSNSDIAGQGLFTNRKLEVGTELGLSHKMIDDNLIRTPLGGFINHSEEPNVQKYQIGNDYFIKVIKDINVGEEITLKYNWYNPVTDND
jgi:hypothetical protein|tara:strand:- start:935 stop:1231 length:297 start_codon:yes stop_codon:yes gene_type:complete